MLALLLTLTLQANPDRPPPDYKPLRYEEDWSPLRDGNRGDFFDPMKYIPLDAAGDVYLTLGGNFRAQMEYYSEEDFGTGPTRDTYLLVRMYPFADFHATKTFRAFVQPKSALAFDTQNKPFPSQQNSIDLHQAFVDVALETGDGTLTIRPGRQELLYGSGRLLDDRSGPNSKFTYDMVRSIFETGELRFDAFFGRPVRSESFGFDDNSRNLIRLWGVYGRIPLGGKIGLEPYVLGIDRKNWVYNEGTDDSLRTVLGARFFSPRGEGFDWNAEPILEVGSFGKGDIAAWGLYTDTGWTFASLPGVPRLGCRADVLSGDRRQGDGNVDTFDSFFPRGILQGEAGSFGPSNMIALTPEFTIQPMEPLYLSARWTFYWRESRQDGLYTLNLGLYAPSGTSDENFVAHEICLTADYYIGRHVILSSVFSFTKTGPFLRDSGYTQDQTFVSATLTVKW